MGHAAAPVHMHDLHMALAQGALLLTREYVQSAAVAQKLHRCAAPLTACVCALQVEELRQQCDDESARASAANAALQQVCEIHGIDAPLLPGDAPVLQSCGAQSNAKHADATTDGNLQEVQQQVDLLQKQNAAIEAERDHARAELSSLWSQLQHLKQVRAFSGCYLGHVCSYTPCCM